MFDFRIGDVFQDAELLKLANEAALKYEDDPVIYPKMVDSCDDCVSRSQNK